MHDFIAPKTLTTEQAVLLLPKREPNSHKGSFGRLLIVAGSNRYTGAAALCTAAALRMGAGIVTLASTRAVVAAAGAKLWEPTFLPLPENATGQIGADALPMLLAESKTATAMLIGCGLGQSADGKALVSGLLQGADCPVLLDADGLNLLAGQTGLLNTAKHLPVLTPHLREMERLCGIPLAAIAADRERLALEFAQAHRCVLVLKDADTVTASHDGRLFIHRGQNAGLSKGGSGDVLAGFAASLLAQRIEPATAAAVAVALHGAAGEVCARHSSKVSMLPHELPEALGALLAGFGL